MSHLVGWSNMRGITVIHKVPQTGGQGAPVLSKLRMKSKVGRDQTGSLTYIRSFSPTLDLPYLQHLQLVIVFFITSSLIIIKPCKACELTPSFINRCPVLLIPIKSAEKEKNLALLFGYRSVKNPCMFLPQVKKTTFKDGELRGFYFVPPNRRNLVDFFLWGIFRPSFHG